MMILWIILAVIVLWAIFSYNGFVSLVNRTKEAWADIDVQLKRRHDLIPNLVETVKGYASHEEQVFSSVTEARAKVGSIQVSKDAVNNPQALQQFQQAQSQLSGALSRLMVVVERYPDLKANQNFMDLQNQLEGTENRINVARVRYNQAVQDFNTTIRVFPNSLTNSLMLHLARKEPFKAEEGARQAPKVKF